MSPISANATADQTPGGSAQIAKADSLDGSLFAAVDLGSNSFHLVVARYEHGQLRVIDRLRDMVRLAAGFDRSGRLSSAARDRALSCLSRMGHRLRSIPEENVRAVGTNTVRRLKRPASFLVAAETALGHPIEIISGREEARLIYVGVERGLATRSGRRLVIDIGGGSTEMIIGHGPKAKLLESMRRGCVGISERYFRGGGVSADQWLEACTSVAVELRDIVPAYHDMGWDDAVGCSGTCRAIQSVVTEMGWAEQQISADSLIHLRDHLLTSGSVRKANLSGLSTARAPVFAGGAAILCTLFEEFGIERMTVSDYALREGVLYDTLGRFTNEDPRDDTVASLIARYQIDEAQAERVQSTSLELFKQVAEDWSLEISHRAILRWAARLHELGLAIAHDHHQRHGAYVLANSDLAGFSRREQAVLAVLVNYHRGSTKNADLDLVATSLQEVTTRLICLLRLAVVLNRGRRSAAGSGPLALVANEHELTLSVSTDWLQKNPLTAADLKREKDYQAQLGIEFEVRESD